MHERHTERADGLGQVGVVGHDHGDVDVELSALRTPQQLHEAVIVLRDEDRDALAAGHVVQRPLHAEALGDGRDVGFECRARRCQTVEVDDRALEEATALGVGRVLIERDDVRAVMSEHAGDGGDDAGLVVAGDEQAGGIGLRHGGSSRVCIDSAVDAPSGRIAKDHPLHCLRTAPLSPTLRA